MAKAKYTYQSYDYSFLIDSGKEGGFFGLAKKVAAKTIGFELVTETPMNEPTGQLYWYDYEPMLDTRWEVTLTEPTATTIGPMAASSTTYTASSDDDEEPKPSFFQDWCARQRNFKEIDKARKSRNEAYWKRRNFFKGIKKQRYGKNF
jgi:hypothetical protein